MMPGGRPGLTSAEKKDLLAFLHMLTDSAFITNPQLADPASDPQAVAK
jgi:cytochrome c peroxidase